MVRAKAPTRNSRTRVLKGPGRCKGDCIGTSYWPTEVHWLAAGRYDGRKPDRETGLMARRNSPGQVAVHQFLPVDSTSVVITFETMSSRLSRNKNR